MIVVILFDVFNAVIVPRPTQRGPRVSSYLVRWTWLAWRQAGLAMRVAQRREAFFGIFAPLAIIALLLVWGIALVVGFGLELHAVRENIRPVPRSLGESIYFAGTSLLTLGFADVVATGSAARTIVLAAAASGIALVAVVISFLFSLFGWFQRREILVVTLDARAGAPPSGVSLLESHAQLAIVPDLERLFIEGQTWAAGVLDSHLAYPILAFFRSSHINASWPATLGALLDAATLLLTTVEGVPNGQAKLLHDVGTHLTEDLSSYFSLPQERAALVERSEFDQARERLRAAGFRLRGADASWAAFIAYRQEYAGTLNAMARFWAIPPAQWIGDRSALSQHHKG
ncbi:MAG: two pore domain potassium channel family protein [Candidatus Eremiobacteraeota bacterium]|nr:two pore domain potassium channel family protein [Candidatus Eremiobacteraeota bacterium]MBC5827216.1 two pore domain potassium channel family protein [Candidatus Eremiobacteraeota bacterium]